MSIDGGLGRRPVGQDDGVAVRYPSLLQPPVGFARAPAGDARGLLAVYVAALEAGATGLEAEVHLTADGEPVLHPGPTLRTGLRRRPLRGLGRADLPPSVPGLGELYETCGTGFHLAMAVADRETAAAGVAAAREAGDGAEDRLWLYAADAGQAASWRGLSDHVRLVEVTRLRRIDTGPERRAAALAEAGIDAVHLPESDWRAGLTTLFHRFGRLALAGGAPHRRQLDALLAMGVDAVSSEHPDRVAEALAALPARA